MKINYRLNTAKLAGIRDEAAWAESMGFDGVCSNETAHDSFIPLSLAATSTSKVKLETRVAIAFPRSPMITSYLARDINELSEGRFRLGLGTQVKGHIERRFSTKWESPSKKLKEYISSIRAILKIVEDWLVDHDFIENNEELRKLKQDFYFSYQ